MRDVWITGIGMLSCVGEGEAAHLEALQKACDGNVSESLNVKRFADYPVHALAAPNFDKQIPKKSDQRQMEMWQRIGVHAAGLALESAELKGDVERLSKLHLIVAAGGGERDQSVDAALLTDLATASDPLVMLNKRLMSDLRPTLFLAQLSNLLAGNISIVHGVTGASRTFMGEQQAGVDAMRTAQARIASGQAEAILVGGSFNAERDDVIMQYALSNALYRGKSPPPVLKRIAPEDGFVFGSGGAFILIESVDHAQSRGAEPYAKLGAVCVTRSKRNVNQVHDDARLGLADSLVESLAYLVKPYEEQSEKLKPDLILTGATGVSSLWQAEKSALDAAFPSVKCVATGDMIGHTLEPHSIFGVAFAALSIKTQSLNTILVTSVGHQRGEGVVMVQKIQ